LLYIYIYIYIYNIHLLLYTPLILLLIKQYTNLFNYAFAFEQDLPLHVQELLIRMKKRKPTAPFPTNLKNFAKTLHFHSPAAYELVRRSFLNCLPCTQILNSWICAKEYKPGISEKIINNVSNIVKQEVEKGKKLVFNLTFDEMNIKEHKEWDKNTHSWKGLVDLGGQLEEANKNGNLKVASKALVFMLVNQIIGYWSFKPAIYINQHKN